MIKRETNASKKAFTLIEIVLAMAIMIIVIPLAFSAFYLVQRSHASVAVMNDAKDYASLNSRAIENLVLNASNASVTSSQDTAYDNSIFSNSGVLYLRKGGVSDVLFDYTQYTITSGQEKWKVTVDFSLSSGTNTLSYTVHLFDNSDPSSLTPYYSLSSSVYLPNGNRNENEKLVTGSGSVFNFDFPSV